MVGGRASAGAMGKLEGRSEPCSRSPTDSACIMPPSLSVVLTSCTSMVGARFRSAQDGAWCLLSATCDASKVSYLFMIQVVRTCQCINTLQLGGPWLLSCIRHTVKRASQHTAISCSSLRKGMVPQSGMMQQLNASYL